MTTLQHPTAKAPVSVVHAADSPVAPSLRLKISSPANSEAIGDADDALLAKARRNVRLGIFSSPATVQDLLAYIKRQGR
ncbi:hypothetical protein [Zhihengliuella flava]|uniref:Uncharacterized protein n=1 Tax=Zhihengliuella flava TaxID=1285193 RepID=A0A931DAS9_9MICC|nr:hypothetical protein [Zhihengliuella flava]MBG6083280.1 hypothetical protein [Zhihengliuella flava]